MRLLQSNFSKLSNCMWHTDSFIAQVKLNPRL